MERTGNASKGVSRKGICRYASVEILRQGLILSVYDRFCVCYPEPVDDVSILSDTDMGSDIPMVIGLGILVPRAAFSLVADQGGSKP